MKKMIVMLLAAAMLLALCACGQQPAEKPVEEAPAAEENAAVEEAPAEAAEEPAAEENAAFVLGGWTPAESPAITVDMENLLGQATESLLGATYMPVAYLGSQLVAGRNHAFVCRVTPVTADPVETYAIVTVYEDLEGKASLRNVYESGAETGISELPGAWSQAGEQNEVNDELQAIFDKALEGYTGMGFKPLALLATQLVSGTNYRFVCESIPVDGGEHGCAIVTVYADLEGNAEISDVVPFAG